MDQFPDTHPADAVLGAAGTHDAPADYSVALGDRLRNVRQQQGQSLHDVERASDGELKASVVGAYERGERAVSVSRLRTLADFYNVPVAELLPGRDRPSVASESSAARGGLRIDLVRLGESGLPEGTVVERFATTIQTRRGDYNGRVLTIRQDDLQTLAAVLDVATDELTTRLLTTGVAHDA